MRWANKGLQSGGTGELEGCVVVIDPGWDIGGDGRRGFG